MKIILARASGWAGIGTFELAGQNPSQKLNKTKFHKQYSSEISPTRCNNCVFILRNGFTLHVSGDNLTHHQEYIYGHR